MLELYSFVDVILSYFIVAEVTISSVPKHNKQPSFSANHESLICASMDRSDLGGDTQQSEFTANRTVTSQRIVYLCAVHVRVEWAAVFQNTL